MSTILVDLLVGFMLVLFAVMALGPLLISSKPTTSTAEDRVISVSPVPMIERLRPLAEKQPHPLGGHLPASHDQRDAA
ncbi:MAG TPA: hypothetical protein VM450_19295 [Thermomicrobiales bacterium]|nr:hypothetical protein [Thermomicrobiales bacterium]